MMKFFNVKQKFAVTAALIATIATGSFVYAAATAVKQDAYYDTFRFVVNGNEQFIADLALKPFIANSRVYVPVATLNNLGIAEAKWTPSRGGSASILEVTPRSSTDTTQLSVLQQQNAQLAASLSAKDAEAKRLVSENNDLKTEITKLKDEITKLKNTSSSSSSSSNVTFEEKKLRSLNERYYEDLYRNPFERRYTVDKIKKDLSLRFNAKATPYRNELDIELTTRDFSQNEWDNYLKDATTRGVENDLYDYVERFVIRPAINEFSNVKDIKINVYIYGGDRNSRDKLATAVYDRNRLDLRLNR